jgi:competence protein ComFC
MLCPTCAARQPAIAGIRSVFRLEGAIRQAIHELKYNNLRAIAPVLAAYLGPTLQESGFEPDTIVPVPLHRSRERRRGYNQSQLLAAALCGATGIAPRTRALARVRNAGSQVGSRSATARADNVADAFVCADESLTGKKVLLVDDVCTTGATLESCAQALRRAGVSQVWGLTVAREV